MTGFSQFMNIVVIVGQWIDPHGIIYSFKSKIVPVTYRTSPWFEITVS